MSSGASTFIVIVHGWETDGADSNYTLFSWASALDKGNMTVLAPASETVGAIETITLDSSVLVVDNIVGPDFTQ